MSTRGMAIYAEFVAGFVLVLSSMPEICHLMQDAWPKRQGHINYELPVRNYENIQVSVGVLAANIINVPWVETPTYDF